MKNGALHQIHTVCLHRRFCFCFAVPILFFVLRRPLFNINASVLSFTFILFYFSEEQINLSVFSLFLPQFTWWMSEKCLLELDTTMTNYVLAHFFSLSFFFNHFHMHIFRADNPLSCCRTQNIVLRICLNKSESEKQVEMTYLHTLDFFYFSLFC